MKMTVKKAVISTIAAIGIAATSGCTYIPRAWKPGDIRVTMDTGDSKMLLNSDRFMVTFDTLSLSGIHVQEAKNCQPIDAAKTVFGRNARQYVEHAVEFARKVSEEKNLNVTLKIVASDDANVAIRDCDLPVTERTFTIEDTEDYCGNPIPEKYRGKEVTFRYPTLGVAYPGSNAYNHGDVRLDIDRIFEYAIRNSEGLGDEVGRIRVQQTFNHEIVGHMLLMLKHFRDGGIMDRCANDATEFGLTATEEFIKRYGTETPPNIKSHSR